MASDADPSPLEEFSSEPIVFFTRAAPPVDANGNEIKADVDENGNENDDGEVSMPGLEDRRITRVYLTIPDELRVTGGNDDEDDDDEGSTASKRTHSQRAAFRLGRYVHQLNRWDHEFSGGAALPLSRLAAKAVDLRECEAAGDAEGAAAAKERVDHYWRKVVRHVQNKGRRHGKAKRSRMEDLD